VVRGRKNDIRGSPFPLQQPAHLALQFQTKRAVLAVEPHAHTASAFVDRTTPWSSHVELHAGGSKHGRRYKVMHKATATSALRTSPRCTRGLHHPGPCLAFAARAPNGPAFDTHRFQ